MQKKSQITGEFHKLATRDSFIPILLPKQYTFSLVL